MDILTSELVIICHSTDFLGMIATWISKATDFSCSKKARPNGCLDFEGNTSIKIRKSSSKTLQFSCQYSEPPFCHHFPPKKNVMHLSDNHYHPTFSHSYQRCGVQMVDQLGDPVPSSNAPPKHFDYVPPDPARR